MIGLHIMRPTSVVVAGAGSSASIRADGGVDFATATGLSLNGVFTAGYDNYMVVFRHSDTTTNDLYIRLRANGTDNSTASSYTRQLLQASSTTISGIRQSLSGYTPFFGSNNLRNGLTVYVYGPNLAQPTAFRGVGVNALNGGVVQDVACTHNQSTAYDGFTYYMDTAGNITGMVTVYGYAQ